MSNLLFPIFPLGAESGARVLTYGARDFREVEAPAASPAARQGFNLEAGWTARADKAVRNEHDANGIHATLKLGRVFLWGEYSSGGGGSYTIHAYSEDRGTLGAGIVTSVTLPAAGEAEITLATALPSSDLEVIDCTEDFYLETGTTDYVRVLLETISSTVKFKIARYEGDSNASSGPGTMAKTHGDFFILVRSK